MMRALMRNCALPSRVTNTVERYVKYQKVPKHWRPKDVAYYMKDCGPLPPFVIDALGEDFTEKELGRLLMSMAK